MYVPNHIVERIKKVAQEKKIAVKTVLNDVGLNYNTMSNLKASFPRADNLAKIADYLDCSVDYLLGRTDNPQAHKSGTAVSVGDVSGNSGAIGVGNTVTNSAALLDEQTAEMLEVYKKLSPLNRAKLRVYADELDKNK